MTDPFASGVAALFGTPLAKAATYRATHPDVAAESQVRVMLAQPDEIVDLSQVSIHAETTAIEIQAASIACAQGGDEIELADGAVFVVQGKPERDRERLVWRLNCRPKT